MSITINKEAYKELVDEDIKWLQEQPRTLERDHIIEILKEQIKDSSYKEENKAEDKTEKIIKKSFNFDFNKIPKEEGVSVAERIFSGLMWHCMNIESIHIDSTDEKGQKYKKLEVIWKND